MTTDEAINKALPTIGIECAYAAESIEEAGDTIRTVQRICRDGIKALERNNAPDAILVRDWLVYILGAASYMPVCLEDAANLVVAIGLISDFGCKGLSVVEATSGA